MRSAATAFVPAGRSSLLPVRLGVNLQNSSRLQWVQNYAAKGIRFGVESRVLMLQSVEQLADAVKATMDPKGRTAVVKQVANATDDTTGNGTTCSTVLTKAVFSKVYKFVAAGLNGMVLRLGTNLSVHAVVAHLKTRAKMISTPDELAPGWNNFGQWGARDSGLNCLSDGESCSHSEKLAIAYGLMRIPRGEPIHVRKTLRVCSNCHTAT